MARNNEVRSLRPSMQFRVAFLSILSVCLAGCGNKFLDPTQIGRFRPVPAVNVILDSLGVAEETPSVWQGAEEPKPIDVVAYETDYVFGPGDVIRITIFELLQEGAVYASDYAVTETGKVSIPEVGVVEAAGLTESQLEEEIKQILSPSILKEPLVAVALTGSQQRAYSIWGDGVPRPGRYPIPRYDFRLTDAIATAGGIGQFNISYVYVSRPLTGEELTTGPTEIGIAEPEAPGWKDETKTGGIEESIDPEKEMMKIIAPRAKYQRRSGNSSGGLVIASTEMITDKELAEAAFPEGFETFVSEETPVDIKQAQGTAIEPVFQQTSPGSSGLTNEDKRDRIEWIFQDGKWIPIQVGRARPTEPEVGVETQKAPEPPKGKMPEKFGWEEIGTGAAQARVIEVPADKLRGGDPRYNIVIKPGDSIHVPVDVVGEYFIYGNTNYQGIVPMSGRPITLKMAVAAAGGLGALAWPKRCEVTRRIGKNKEETVMVDLDKIASGEQPDFFIKPLDLINVGTHPTARWRAVVRNSFRATYGFGFVYDRNFADRDFGLRRPLGPFNVGPFDYGYLEDLLPTGWFNNN
ncbi:MAG: polysaccharide biosynthesis/export family protein [Sedimentisphaerales bacterium]|nr:polysaccharide biosynthesis/export family protein [Sedimentisphaerales bacterium]